MPLLPSGFLGNTASQAAMLALTGVVNDWTIRTDQSNKAYQLTALPASTLGNWTPQNNPPYSGLGVGALNSKSFATGNGSTNDSAGLTTWLGASDNIFLSAGAYSISTTVLNTAASRLMINCDPNASLVPIAAFGPAAGAFLRIENKTYLHIKGLRIVGNGIGTASLDPDNNNNYSLYAINCTNVIFEDCDFTETPKGAIRADNCTNLTIINCKVPASNNYAFEIQYCTNVKVLHNKVSGRHAAQKANAGIVGRTPGIMFFVCTDVVCDGNDIRDFKNTGTKMHNCTKVKYFNNTVENCGKDSLKIQGSAVDEIGAGTPLFITDGFEIIGNTIKHRDQTADATDGASLIEIYNCKNGVIHGNVCIGGKAGVPANQQEIGINITATATDAVSNVTVGANYIENVGGNGLVIYNGKNINVNGVTINNYGITNNSMSGMDITNSHEFSISNCKVKNDSIPAAGTNSGIILVNCKNYKFTKNQIINSRSFAIVTSLNTSEFVEISDNHLEGVQDYLLRIKGYSDDLVASDTILRVIKHLKVTGNVFIDATPSGGYQFTINTNRLSIAIADCKNNTYQASSAASVSMIVESVTEGSNSGVTGVLTLLDNRGLNYIGTSTAPNYNAIPGTVLT